MNIKIAIIAAAISIMLPGVSLGQSSYELGTTLTSEQISALGRLKTFNVANKTYRILPQTSASGNYVINDLGKVGKCEGDVLISGVPTDQAKQAFVKYQTKTVSVKVYDSLKIVSARFVSVVDAAQARNELAETIPSATVSLPIVFNLPKAK